MKSMFAFFKSIRVCQCLASALVLYLFSANLSYSIAFLLLLAFSYSFNDILDYALGNDCEAHPHRPLPSGALSLKNALIGCVGLAMLFCLQIVWMPSVSEKQVLLGGIAISALYSLFLKRWYPGFAMPIWSTMTVVVFLQATHVEPIYYVLCAVFFVGRELLLDVRDEKTDKKLARLPSLATLLGVWARPLAVAGMLLPLLFLLVFTQQSASMLLMAIVLFVLALALTYKEAPRMEAVSKAGYLFVLFTPHV